MWGEVLNNKILTAAATSANQVHPGTIARFRDGTIARYIQGAATLDNNTLAAGEPALLLPAGSSWDDPYCLYLGTNVSDATGASTGLVVGAFVLAGFAAVAIPETYWGWAITYGRCAYIRCHDASTAAYEYLVLDNATATVDGMSLKNADADGQTAYGWSFTADIGTPTFTVDAFVNSDGIGCMFDIA